MSTTLGILIGIGAVIGLAVLGFLGLVMVGYWQHIRAGRKIHRAIETDKRGE